MFHVVTIRTGHTRYAHNHIVIDDSDRSLCDEAVPGFILELGMNSRNPYVDGNRLITCQRCYDYWIGRSRNV